MVRWWIAITEAPSGLTTQPRGPSTVRRHSPLEGSLSFMTSPPADAMKALSGLTPQAETPPPWPSSVSASLPVARSQTFRIPSELPVTTKAPSGLTAQALTCPAWPGNTVGACPERSQIQTFPSLPPATSSRPSGLTAQHSNPHVSPSKRRISPPVVRSHTLIALRLTRAAKAPSGPRASAPAPVHSCPLGTIVRSSPRLDTSHSFSAPSTPTEMTLAPSGLTAQPLTQPECPASVPMRCGDSGIGVRSRSHGAVPGVMRRASSGARTWDGNSSSH